MLLLTLVAVNPVAKHPVFRRQATLVRNPKTTTLGLGSMVQAEPFQFSMKGVGV